MKNHLKQIAVPKTWEVNRKEKTFTVRPNPGAHSLEMGLPLGLVLRDILKLAGTMDEIKKMLNSQEVLVDGKRRKDHRFIIGLFDILSISTLKKSYRILFDHQGCLTAKEINASESSVKLGKIVGKKMTSGGKIQLSLHDGKNIIVAENNDTLKKAKLGDSLLLNVPKQEVKELISLVKGAKIYLIKGKHRSDRGEFVSVSGNIAVYKKGNVQIETDKSYLFVVGKDKEMISLA